MKKQTANQPALPQLRPEFSQEYHRAEVVPGIKAIGTDGDSAKGATFPSQLDPLVVGRAATPVDSLTSMGGIGGVVNAEALGVEIMRLISRVGGVIPGQGDDSRTEDPGVIETTTLAALLGSFYDRCKALKTESSWSGYRTLVRKWEASHDGCGPYVTKITEETLQAFFESREEWHSQRSWQRNRDLFFALLKSGCPRTLKNRDGHPSPMLRVDALPVWDLPPARWFRDRTAPQLTRGGHRKRKLELLTVEQFGSVMDGCSVAIWKAPEFWRAWLGLVWFCGPRFEDVFRYRWNTGQLHVNRQRQLLDFTETKCGGNTAVPLPAGLRDLLEPLWMPSRDGKPVFVGPRDSQLLTSRSQVANRARNFDVEYAAIWEEAGVEKRQPHELRSVCVSHWMKHAEKYRFAVTGHSAKGDVQLTNYVILDDDFRQACESFPMPSVAGSFQPAN